MEDAKATRLAITSHNLNVQKALTDLAEIRVFLEKKSTLDDIAKLDKLNGIKNLLSHFQLLNEGARAELVEFLK